ncbi:MAG: hypothetical protein QOE86_1344, partial [Solirubrobacteraceae bacterium]|nr:hypothetical protein [Solirubrobacteraceae bacterium]
TAYFFWKVPETKDRTLEEIEHELGTDPDEVREQTREGNGRFDRERTSSAPDRTLPSGRA